MASKESPRDGRNGQGTKRVRVAKPKDAPVTELAKSAADDAKELAKTELELAREEMTELARAAKPAAAAAAVGTILAIVGAEALVVAGIAALARGRRGPLAVALFGSGILAGGAAAVAWGVRHAPRELLQRARSRVAMDARLIASRLD